MSMILSSPLRSCLHCFLVSLSSFLSRLIVFSSPLFSRLRVSRLHCFLVSIVFSSPLLSRLHDVWKLLNWQPRCRGACCSFLSTLRLRCVCVLRLRRVFMLRLFFGRSRCASLTPKHREPFAVKCYRYIDKRLPLNRFLAQRTRLSVPVWWWAFVWSSFA